MPIQLCLRYTINVFDSGFLMCLCQIKHFQKQVETLTEQNTQYNHKIAELTTQNLQLQREKEELLKGSYHD